MMDLCVLDLAHHILDILEHTLNHSAPTALPLDDSRHEFVVHCHSLHIAGEQCDDKRKSTTSRIKHRYLQEKALILVMSDENDSGKMMKFDLQMIRIEVLSFLI